MPRVQPVLGANSAILISCPSCATVLPANQILNHESGGGCWECNPWVRCPRCSFVTRQAAISGGRCRGVCPTISEEMREPLWEIVLNDPVQERRYPLGLPEWNPAEAAGLLRQQVHTARTRSGPCLICSSSIFYRDDPWCPTTFEGRVGRVHSLCARARKHTPIAEPQEEGVEPQEGVAP